MSVTHLVMFAFKPGTSAEVVKEIEAGMLALKEQCIKPDTKEPYIVSSRGGTDMSIENTSDNLTHAYVVEFDSVGDRDYYVNSDGAHHAFVKAALPHLEKLTILDFQSGQFNYLK